MTTSSESDEGSDNREVHHDEVEKDEDWTAWIPPDRPLAGDQGQSYEYAQHHQHPEDNSQEEEDDDDETQLRNIERQLREMEEQETRQQLPLDEEDGGVDWLQTRRQRQALELSQISDMQEQPQQQHSAVHMLTPKQAASHKDRMLLDQIPTKKHTLLSKNEICACLESLGGLDICVIFDNPHDRRMGGPHGMILVTGRTCAQLRVLANALVKLLRLRDLDQLNVVGAQLGPEGSTASDETWLVVDCRNYVVHIQDETTRAAVDLEGLWTVGKHGDSLRRLNALNENAVDDYVARNPVPENYNAGHAAVDEMNLGSNPWMQLQKNRWTSPHRPVIPTKLKSRRKGRRNR